MPGGYSVLLAEQFHPTHAVYELIKSCIIKWNFATLTKWTGCTDTTTCRAEWFIFTNAWFIYLFFNSNIYILWHTVTFGICCVHLSLWVGGGWWAAVCVGIDTAMQGKNKIVSWSSVWLACCFVITFAVDVQRPMTGLPLTFLFCSTWWSSVFVQKIMREVKKHPIWNLSRKIALQFELVGLWRYIIPSNPMLLVGG